MGILKKVLILSTIVILSLTLISIGLSQFTSPQLSNQYKGSSNPLDIKSAQLYTADSDKSNKCSSGGTGMANPASVYCHQLGYEYKIVDTDNGQKGICVFPDKTECDEWEFLEGKCGKKYSYCAKQGYDQIVKTDGKNSLTRDYAVCVQKQKVIGSVTELLRLSEKSTAGSATTEQSSSPKSKSVSIESLPTSFDWRNKDGLDWMTPVKNQGDCSSCWAFSAVGITEAMYNIRNHDTNLDLDLAEEYLVSDCFTSSMGDQNCCGGLKDQALFFIKDNGIPDEDCMNYVDTNCTCCDPIKCPYHTGSSCSNATCSYRCWNWWDRLTKLDYVSFVSGRDNIKQVIVDKGPVVASMGIGSGYGGYWNGDIYRCTNDNGHNHAVIIVGYDDVGQYWIVKNSWGTDWPYTGADGYFKVGYGECWIENDVYYADARPDLVISHVYAEKTTYGARIHYFIENIGLTSAFPTFYVDLFIDNKLIAQEPINFVFPPNNGGDFIFYVSNICQYSDKGVEVKVDSTNAVDESWEENNEYSTKLFFCGCPHVYAWNGTDYILDNNLLPFSDNPNRSELLVEDYYKLEKPLVQSNGKYSLMIGEFEQEHSYFDQVQLLAIDHGSDFKIAASPSGEILTYKNPIPSLTAFDNNLNYVAPVLSSIDGNYFEGNKGDFIILNFGKVNSDNAKLIMRSDLPPRDVKWSIHVQVLKDGKWQEVAIVLPRNYWADDIVDLSDYLTDEDLIVRLYFTSTHKIDFVGLDTSGQEEFDIIHGNLVSAVHSEYGNVKQKLAKADETYAELIPGQNIKLDFTLPNSDKEVRDFIFYSKGYYYKIQ